MVSACEQEFNRISNILEEGFVDSKEKDFEISWINNWYKVENLSTLPNFDICIIGNELEKSKPNIVLQKTTYYHSTLPFLVLKNDIDWPTQQSLVELGAFSFLENKNLSGSILRNSVFNSISRFKIEGKQKNLNEMMSEQIVTLEDTNERLFKQTQEYVTLAEDLAIAQYEAEQNELQVRAIVESSPNGIWYFSTIGKAISINAKLKDFLEIDPAFEETQENLLALFEKGTQKTLKSEMKKWALGKITAFEIYHINKKSKKEYVFSIKGVPIKDSEGGIESCLATFTDITEQKEAEETIKRLALSDSLTGLANRSKFNERLTEAINLSRRLDAPMAVMFLDLDKFKTVNDTYGHPAGDALLVEVSKRLLDSIREIDTVARLGGDEFGIIITNLESLNAVNIVASRIINSLAIPIAIDNNFIETATSIGISFFPKDGKTKDDLIQKADLALYQAKSKGRGIFNLYDKEMHKEAERIQEIETDIDKALVRGEFRLNFQPQINAISGKLIGAEALIRWEHPEKGNIPPGIFIPVSDNCKLAIPIGDWVLEEACLQTMAWQNSGLEKFCISVNISLKQFQDNDFVRTVENTLQQTMLDPELLELEITEGMVIDDIDGVQKKLSLLKELGVKLAIDDFGTGYSSLAHLKRFPIDKLKVDQSFVRTLHESDIDANIVKTVINLGHSLNLKVIAEGVEEKSQLEFLQSNDCDEIQGYFISKPMESDHFFKWAQNAQKT